MRRAAPRDGPSTENRRPSRPRAVALRQGPPCGRGSWSRQRKTAVGGLTQDHLLSVVATTGLVYGTDGSATSDLFGIVRLAPLGLRGKLPKWPPEARKE